MPFLSKSEIREVFSDRQLPTQPGEAGFLARLINFDSALPSKIVDMNDDDEMTELVSHVLKPGEKLGQFYSRTGLSKAQAALMSKAEITAFCLAAEKSHEADGVREPRRFGPPL